MKDIRNVCFFLILLFAGTIANGQIIYKDYLKPSVIFHANGIFTPISFNTLDYTYPTHVWLSSLNSQYIDTTKNKINAFAIPEYHEIKNRGLFGPHHVKKQMAAGLYYHPYFFRTIPYAGRLYDPISQPYSQLPYGYSSFSIKASGSPYYILPKF